MKCIILAAGEGIRMKPLTNDTPKPMLKIGDKPILGRILNDLPENVDEIILVVGYLKEKIIDYFGNKFGRFRIQYVIQEGKLGTYHALESCKDLIADDEKFLMMYADDLHGAENLQKCAQGSSCTILAYKAEDPRKFGVLETDSDGFITGIEEKPEHPKTDLVSIGAMVLDKDVFKYPARRHSNGEYYLTDSIEQMILAGYKFKAVNSSIWIPIGYPEDLVRAEKIINNKNENRKG